MGQDWTISARRLKECIYLGKMGEYFFGTPLVWLLARPTRPSAKTVTEKPRELADDEEKGDPTHDKPKSEPTADDKKSKPRLELLPLELLDQIFAEMDIKTLVAASLSSPYFWDVASKHFENYFMSSLGTWAGESIVCVGNEIHADDCPPGMLTTEEVEKLSRLTINNWMGKTSPMNLFDYFDEENGFRSVATFGGEARFRSKSHRLWNDAWIWYYKRMEKCMRKPKTAYDKWLRSLFSDDNGEIAWSALSHRILDFYPEDEKWILRNLTNKVFVRAEAIAIDPSRIRGPCIEGVGFGEVVLSRICWSSTDALSMVNSTNMHRGVWAGHTFDIVTESEHLREMERKHEDWTDVSKEVAQEMAIILESEFGENWRRVVLRG